MSKLTDKIAGGIEREAYLREHCNEYPFPLNGTDWAREIREHQFWQKHPADRCEGASNFLTKLHDRGSLMKRQRAVVYRALHHWFLTDLDQAFWMKDQLNAGELACLQLQLQAREEVVSSLADVEKTWLKHEDYTAGKKNSKVAVCYDPTMVKQLDAKASSEPLAIEGMADELEEESPSIEQLLAEVNVDDLAAEDLATEIAQPFAWEI